MKKTPNQQRYLDSQKASRNARAMSQREKPLQAKLDTFFMGKSSFKDDADRVEINKFMELS